MSQTDRRSGLERIEVVGEGGGCICSPADCIQPDTALENVLAQFVSNGETPSAGVFYTRVDEYGGMRLVHCDASVTVSHSLSDAHCSEPSSYIVEVRRLVYRTDRGDELLCLRRGSQRGLASMGPAGIILY